MEDMAGTAIDDVANQYGSAFMVMLGIDSKLR
jgi:hypothetical protein